MKISGITMVKNEEEFIGYTIMSMYHHLDEIIVVDGGSEDNTENIIAYIIENHDPDCKIKFWKDYRPKHELIHVRNDMVAVCTGDWILRLEGDEVYSDRNGNKVIEYLKSGRILPNNLSVGWPYYFFVNDINTFVPIGQNHTFATIMIKNNQGIYADHHDKGGGETFYDEGWFSPNGKNVSIAHPKDNPTQRISDIFIHHYAGFKASTRHKNYMLKCKKVAFKDGHPEVFKRFDFKPLMKNSKSKAIISEIEGYVGVTLKKNLREKLRYLVYRY